MSDAESVSVDTTPAPVSPRSEPGSTTTGAAPAEVSVPAPEPIPAAELQRVTDNSSERISATPPPSPTLSPALRQGPTPVSQPPTPAPMPQPEPEPTPEPLSEPEVVPEAEVPEPEPAQSSPRSEPGSTTGAPEKPATPAAAATITIKDRLYAALEKIRFNKRAKLDKIVQLARQKGRIKNDDVQLAVRVSDSTAQRYLNQLVVEARLRRVGHQNQPTYEPL